MLLAHSLKEGPKHHDKATEYGKCAEQSDDKTDGFRYAVPIEIKKSERDGGQDQEEPEVLSS